MKAVDGVISITESPVNKIRTGAMFQSYYKLVLEVFVTQMSS